MIWPSRSLLLFCGRCGRDRHLLFDPLLTGQREGIERYGVLVSGALEAELAYALLELPAPILLGDPPDLVRESGNVDLQLLGIGMESVEDGDAVPALARLEGHVVVLGVIGLLLRLHGDEIALSPQVRAALLPLDLLFDRGKEDVRELLPVL